MSTAAIGFTHRFAQRLEGCGTEGAFVVLAQAKLLESQGRDIIHLQIGEPDFDTPSNIIARAHWALDNHYTHYTPSAGLHPTREKYAEYANRRYGRTDLTWKNIVVMPGAKPVVFLTMMALVDPGDDVVHFNPTYPAYDAAIHLVRGVHRHLDLHEENSFRFDHDQFRSLVSDLHAPEPNGRRTDPGRPGPDCGVLPEVRVLRAVRRDL
jgi:aspartate/methionine/tyrosine aminotransferase